MTYPTALPILAASLILATMSSAALANCDDPRTSDEIAECLGLELREADSQINLNYKSLMGKLDASGKQALRTEQRNWIKDRDADCRLDTKESNREKWYRALLRDYSKTVCVTRYTTRRTGELEGMLAALSAKPGSDTKPATPAPSAPARGADIAYDNQPPTTHTHGKWYFEVAIDHAAVAEIEPCVIDMGVWTSTVQSGVLNNIRKRDAGKGIKRYGIAIDLDNGKFYHSENGAWVNGQPGTNLGMNLKTGDTHKAAVQTSAESIAPYLKAKAIVPNYGGAAMTYALPEGYSPWQNSRLY